MFRRTPMHRRPQSTTLSFQPLEPRLPMAGDMSFTFASSGPVIDGDQAAGEVAKLNESVFVAPSLGTVKAIGIDYAGEHVTRLAAMEKVLEAALAMKEAEQAGLSLDVAKESKLVDPATGDVLSAGSGSATAFDPALPGRGDSDPLGSGMRSSVSDPATGKPLLGGSDSGGAAGPSPSDMVAAGRAGKGRAMDDSNVVTDKTVIVAAITFAEATKLATEPGGSTWTTADGNVRNIQAGITEDGTPYVWLSEKRPDGTSANVIYYKGGSIFGESLDKPRPDDDGGTPPRQLTEQEKQQIMAELRGSFGPAGQPRDDYDPAQPRGGAGEVLTYLDRAGQPRPDDDGQGGGGATGGPVLTDLGLAGQPVGDDPNFGVLAPRFGGPQPLNGGFGGVVLDANKVVVGSHLDGDGRFDGHLR